MLHHSHHPPAATSVPTSVLPLPSGSYGGLHLHYPIHQSPFVLPPTVAPILLQPALRPPQQMGLHSPTSSCLSHLVAQSSYSFGWCSICTSHTTSYSHDTCFACRLGCSSRRPCGSGSLVTQGSADTSQHPRAASRLPCLPAFLPLLRSCYVHLLLDNMATVVYINKQGGDRFPPLSLPRPSSCRTGASSTTSCCRQYIFPAPATPW